MTPPFQNIFRKIQPPQLIITTLPSPTPICLRSQIKQFKSEDD